MEEEWRAVVAELAREFRRRAEERRERRRRFIARNPCEDGNENWNRDGASGEHESYLGERGCVSAPRTASYHRSDLWSVTCPVLGPLTQPRSPSVLRHASCS